MTATQEQTVASVTVTAYVDGAVVVNSAATAQVDGGVSCSLTTGFQQDSDYDQTLVSGESGLTGQLAGTRMFPITGGTTATYNLVCYAFGGSGTPPLLTDIVLTAIFTPEE